MIKKYINAPLPKYKEYYPELCFICDVWYNGGLNVKDYNETVDKFLYKFMPIVDNLAERYAVYPHEYDDLFQVGCMGLLESLAHYVNFCYIGRKNFKAYVQYYVFGYMQRYIQKNDTPTCTKLKSYYKHNNIEEDIYVGQCSDVKSILIDYVKSIKCNITLDKNKALFVIFYRYGLIDGEFHTLQDIASLFNVSRERIRQLEEKIFKYIRKCKNKTYNQLHEFIN